MDIKTINKFRKQLLKKLNFHPYDIKKTIEQYPDSIYYMIIGERTGGKTYSSLDYCLERYFLYGEEFVYLRRFEEDIKKKRMDQVFSPFVNSGYISMISEGKYNDVYYYAGKFYLCETHDDKRIRAEKPFAYALSINTMVHDKSTSYPNVVNLIFDEFLTRQVELVDEFADFMNVISTIFRTRENCKIIMLGNTVNKYSTYFKEMGLNHVTSMSPGSIDVYNYGDSKLQVVVERTTPQETNGKPNDYIFAFDNPRLKMITGGAWEVDIYPHIRWKYLPKDVVLTFWIDFDDALLKCDIISDDMGTYIHIKPHTSERKRNDEIVYGPECSPDPYHIRRITDPVNNVTKVIRDLFKSDKVFYSSNEVGEIVRNYLIWCKK